MSRIFLAFLGGLLVLSGCARGYVITMNNGERIKAATKPHFERGFYYFKDASGRPAEPVSAGRIREIAPASMVEPEPASVFKPVSSK